MSISHKYQDSMPHTINSTKGINSHYINRVSVLYLAIVLCLTWTQLIGISIFFAKSWVFILIGLLSIFVINPEFFRRTNLIIPILLYGAIVFLNFLWGDYYFGSFPDVCLEIGVLFVCSSIVFYCFSKKDFTFVNSLFYLIIFILVYSCVATYLLDSQVPGIVRDATGEAYKGNPSRLWYYYKYGMSSYELPHALPILIPPIVMGIRKGRTTRFKLGMLFLLLVVVLLIYLSSATTPLLMSFVVLALSLLLSPTNKKRNILLIVVSLLTIIIVLNETIILQLLDLLNNGFIGNNVFFREKILDFERMVLLGDSDNSDISTRMSLYNQTLSVFRENIIWGTDAKLGGHSALMDRLSSLGLIGFLPYVMVFIYHFRFFYGRFTVKTRLYYILGFLYGIVLLFSKSMSNWNTFLLLFVLLPLSIIMIEKQAQKGLRNNARIH